MGLQYDILNKLIVRTLRPIFIETLIIYHCKYFHTINNTFSLDIYIINNVLNKL